MSPLSQSSALSFLFKKLEERKRTYVAALARLALSADGHEPMVCYGRIDFLGSQEEIPDKASLDYKGFRLVQARLSVEEASMLARDLAEGKGLSVEGLNIPIKGQFYPSPLPYVASRQHFGFIQAEWPFALCNFRLESEYAGNAPQEPLVGLGLPLYPNGNDAIREFCQLAITSGMPSHELHFVLPDFRARIRTMKISERKLSVEVEAREETPENLRIKFYVEADQNRLRSQDLPLQNGCGEFAYEGELRLAMARLLSTSTGDDIDNRAFSPWRAYDREGIAIETSELRVTELVRRGEGLNVEFKEEPPRDEHQLLDTVVAFANTNGGTVLVGVTDNCVITGVPNPETIKEKVTNWISDKCDPPPQFSIHFIQVDQKNVVVLDVPEGTDKPYQDIDRGFFVRRGASNRQARRSEILEMIRGR